MNTCDNNIDVELIPLREQAWGGGAVGHARIERRLVEAHSHITQRRGGAFLTFMFRHRLAVATLGIAALAGGAIGGSYLYDRLYSITVSDDQGNVLSMPRVLVAPGQKASITVGDPNDPDNSLSVNIDENGNVTSNRDDLNVDVKVQDVDAKAAQPPMAKKPAPRP